MRIFYFQGWHLIFRCEQIQVVLLPVNDWTNHNYSTYSKLLPLDSPIWNFRAPPNSQTPPKPIKLGVDWVAGPIAYIWHYPNLDLYCASSFDCLEGTLLYQGSLCPCSTVTDPHPVPWMNIACNNFLL